MKSCTCFPLFLLLASLKCRRLKLSLFQDGFTLIFESFLLPSWRMMQLSIQNFPRKFIVCHSYNMAYPQEMALGKCGLNARSVGSNVNSVVGNVVIPYYAEDTFKALVLIYVICTKFMPQSHKEGFTHTMLHFSLGCGFKVMVVENSLVQSSECCRGLVYPTIDSCVC